MSIPCWFRNGGFRSRTLLALALLSAGLGNSCEDLRQPEVTVAVEPAATTVPVGEVVVVSILVGESGAPRGSGLHGEGGTAVRIATSLGTLSGPGVPDAKSSVDLVLDETGQAKAFLVSTGAGHAKLRAVVGGFVGEAEVAFEAKAQPAVVPVALTLSASRLGADGEGRPLMGDGVLAGDCVELSAALTKPSGEALSASDLKTLGPVVFGTDLGYFLSPEGGTAKTSVSVTPEPSGAARAMLTSSIPGMAHVVAGYANGWDALFVEFHPAPGDDISSEADVQPADQQGAE